MNKNLIYAGYVAVGAFIVYLLLKKDNKKPIDTKKEISTSNSETPKGTESVDFIRRPPNPKPNERIAKNDSNMSTMTDQELIKIAIDNKCQSGGMFNLLKDKLYKNAVAEIRRRGLDMSAVDNHKCIRNVFVSKDGKEILPQ